MENRNRIKKKLVSLFKTTFPKKCNNCNRLYNDEASLMSAFDGLQENKLVEYTDDDISDGATERKVVANYALCPCGSTLFALFADRRDDAGGYREAFNEVVLQCVQGGYSEVKAQDRVRELFRNFMVDATSIEDILNAADALLNEVEASRNKTA